MHRIRILAVIDPDPSPPPRAAVVKFNSLWEAFRVLYPPPETPNRSLNVDELTKDIETFTKTWLDGQIAKLEAAHPILAHFAGPIEAGLLSGEDAFLKQLIPFLEAKLAEKWALKTA